MQKIQHEDKEVELVSYELGYHLVPSLGEDDLALRVGELVKLATANGGTLIAEGYPQSFVLSYTMKRLRGGKWEKYDTAFFGWLRFSAPAETVVALKEALDHSEHVVRYLLIKLSKEDLAGPAAHLPRNVETGEVMVEPKTLTKKRDVEEKGEVSEVELDKELEDLIK